MALFGRWQDISCGSRTSLLSSPTGSQRCQAALQRQRFLLLQAALHIVMYLTSMRSYGIVFQWDLNSGIQLALYVDADRVDDANGRTSVSEGLGFKLVSVYRSIPGSNDA